MKKTIVMALALALALGLAACGESSAGSDAENRLTAYQPSFEEISAEYGDDIQDLSYFLFDLNGDGVAEILIKGTLSYDEYKWLYALDGDKPVKIGEYWSRRDYTGIYSGGYIYGFGSNGADDNVYFIEQMKPGGAALTTMVSVENHQDENGNIQFMLNGEKVAQAEAETALKAYDNTRGEEIVPKWMLYADSSVKSTPDINMPESNGGEDLAYWNGFDFGSNLTYDEEYETQGDSGEYINAAEAAKVVFDEVKANGNISGYSENTEYKMTLVDLMDVNGEECYVYRCDGGAYGAGFAYAYQSGSIYMQGYGGQWVPMDASNDGSNEINWEGEFNSINYVMHISAVDYDGGVFDFNIDDEITGVAEFAPDDPYSAYCGEIYFSFDGKDTINVTNGGDYSETYFRSQYQ